MSFALLSGTRFPGHLYSAGIQFTENLSLSYGNYITHAVMDCCPAGGGNIRNVIFHFRSEIFYRLSIHRDYLIQEA